MKIERNHDLFRQIERDYWDYYRELEDEFIHMRKYVDFNQDNFGTYSVELLKLLQAICSEIDVIGKSMASLVKSDFKPEEKRNNIYKWWYIIQDEYTVTESYSGIFQEPMENEVNLNDYTPTFCDTYEICAWENFRIEIRPNKNGNRRHGLVKGYSVPSWWSDYNKVKHNRMSIILSDNEKRNYRKANLGNVCRAFAALYILEKALMEAVGTKNDLEAFANYSELFTKPTAITAAELDKLMID